MGEEDVNPCAFKSVCHITHNIEDETCGHHLVKTTEECPLNKFAIRIQKDFVFSLKEAIRHKWLGWEYIESDLGKVKVGKGEITLHEIYDAIDNTLKEKGED